MRGIRYSVCIIFQGHGQLRRIGGTFVSDDMPGERNVSDTLGNTGGKDIPNNFGTLYCSINFAHCIEQCQSSTNYFIVPCFLKGVFYSAKCSFERIDSPGITKCRTRSATLV